MAFCVQQVTPIPEDFPVEPDLGVDSEMPDGGQLKTEGKTYPLARTPSSPEAAKLQHVAQGSKSPFKAKVGTSPMQLAKQTYQTQGKQTSQSVQMPRTATTPAPQAAKSSMLHQTQQDPVRQTQTPKASFTRGETAKQASEARTEKPSRQSKQQNSPLQARQWTKETTTSWWQQRHEQKEREGQREQKQEQQDQPDQENKKNIKGVHAAATSSRSFPTRSDQQTVKKPILERPKTGVFALYYILTKLGIYSDGTSNFSYKKEIESIDVETTTAHKKRLEEIRKAIDKEHSAARWSTANKVFSWIGSLVAVVSGVLLIATGVGAVAGAMLIAGGLIQITNQLLDMTGGWKKIAELLPGDSPEKKRAVISWMQIGIAVLCLVLSGAGIVFNGFASFGEVASIAQKAMGAFAYIGGGVTTIGGGVMSFMASDRRVEERRYDKILTELRGKRQDLMERVQSGTDRLEQLFEDLANALEFEVELFRADQMVNR